jgi:hypothetical protein
MSLNNPYASGLGQLTGGIGALSMQMPAPAPVPNVPDRLAHLGQGLDSIHDAINALSERIGGVLRPSPPTQATDLGVKDGGLSPLENQIAEVVQKCDCARERLIDLVARLAL